nr:MAG TPA: hypothetical protein [Caudoviricetes sp.]
MRSLSFASWRFCIRRILPFTSFRWFDSITISL